MRHIHRLRNLYLTIETKTTPVATSVCSKCGTILKTGKASCCGRGGAWFGNCADEVNEKFDHTWIEGVKVCKNKDKG